MVTDIKSEQYRPIEPNVAYIGEGVCFKGAVSVPDLVIVDGMVEGDIAARSVRVGPSGSIKGNITSTDADVYGSVLENVEVKQLLIVRSTGRIEGEVSYGEVQVEKGAVIAGAFTSTEFRAERLSSERVPLNVERLRIPMRENTESAGILSLAEPIDHADGMANRSGNGAISIA